MVKYHLSMLGGPGNVQVEIMKYLICHVTLANHMIEGSCNFMSGNSSLYVIEI